jgi:hypothetical protein
MRKSLWIVLTAFFLSMGALSAHADTVTNYTITFTAASGILPTSGSFTYDSSTPKFSNFLVVWDGLSFDLTSSANTPLIFGPVPPACLGGDSNAAATFQLLTNCGDLVTGWLGKVGGSPASRIFTFVSPTESCIFDADCISISAVTVPVGPISEALGFGSFAVAVSTPEPSTVALMLAGIGLLLVMRKRVGQGLPQAS